MNDLTLQNVYQLLNKECGDVYEYINCYDQFDVEDKVVFDNLRVVDITTDFDPYDYGYYSVSGTVIMYYGKYYRIIYGNGSHGAKMIFDVTQVYPRTKEVIYYGT